MITSHVTKEQLTEWHILWQQHHALMHPNRISGTKLDAYFREKYQPRILENAEFSKVVCLNVMERAGHSIQPEIKTYQTQNGVLVGIDLTTGEFHVENENTEAMAAVWDDLFVARGLSDEDLQNYVLTAQYIQLKAAQEKSHP